MPRATVAGVKTFVVLACLSFATVVAAQPAKAPVSKPQAPTSCEVNSCAYHAGADGYFTCLAGGAGACFHFGGTCAPQDRCMYNAATKRYATCDDISEGKCQRFGKACSPSTGCWFTPADGLHHACEKADAEHGTCNKVGALCAP